MGGGPCVVQVVPLLGVRSLAARTFDYLVGESADAAPPSVGSVVRIPFGRRRITGVVVAHGASGAVDSSRLLRAEVVGPEAVSEDLLELARELSEYYLAPWGACLRAVVPAHLLPAASGSSGRRVTWVRPIEGADLDACALTPRQRSALAVVPDEGLPLADVCRLTGVGRGVVQALVEKGALTATGERVDRPRSVGGVPRPDCPEGGAPAARPRLILSAEQQAAVDELSAALETPDPESRLLWGVTGSGKTEVYTRVFERVVDSGGGAILLVPEIALTGQVVERLRARFGETVGVLHSALSPGQRAAQHREIAGGRARVVVGARSAVFAPVPQLRVIVVDEAHDSSYKQDEEPRYDARTVAWWRVRRVGGLLIEGTATPRVETLVGGARPILLRERPTGGALPDVEVVDMRRQGGVRVLAPRSRRALQETVSRGEQAIVLLNRRGYAGFLHCDHCGHVPMCARCEVSLTYHRSRNGLFCHHCGFQAPTPGLCPVCGEAALARGTPGTEKLADELRGYVPEDGLFRLDSDVVTSGTRVREILQAFGRTTPAILVGTQMVAKGHDFPLVTLVVVADADTGLYLPDLRSVERTFQLLVQVSGRAGRAAHPGRVLVQTWNPEVPCIRMAVDRDVQAFYRDELAARERLGYPPFGRLIRVLVSSREEARAQAGASYLADRLRPHLAEGSVRGPARLPRLRGRARWQLLLLGDDAERSRHLLARAAEQLRAPYARRGVDLIIDVDPQWSA